MAVVAMTFNENCKFTSTNTGLFFRSSRKILHREQRKPSSAVSHYYATKEEPLGAIMTRTTDSFRGSAQLPLAMFVKLLQIQKSEILKMINLRSEETAGFWRQVLDGKYP